MRPLEILLLLLLLPQAAFPLALKGTGGSTPGRARLLLGVSLVALLAAGLHAVLEGARWQMAPAYALVVVVLAGRLWQGRPRDHDHPRPPNPPRTRIGERVLSLVGLLFLAASALLAATFPVPRLPELTGPYPVGTLTLHLVDEARPEIYTARPDDPRQLMVQIWYPAAPGSGDEPGPWMPEADRVGQAIARRLGLPGFLLGHLQLARTNAFPGAPAESPGGPYPVVLFAHGWGGLRTQNIAQVEDLASHGYVVAAADHAYGAVVSVFPGGEVAPWKREILPFGAPQEEFDAASNQLVRVWSGDLGFVLDQLADLNTGNGAAPLAGLMDLGRVGVLGHSTGGGTAVEFCAEDERCLAGLAMDAWLEPVSRDVISAGLRQPFLFMRSEAWEQPDYFARNDRLQERLFESLQGGGYRLAVAGTAHFDFSSLSLFSPLAPLLGLKGPIDGQRVTLLVNEYSLAFFDMTLKGQPAPLLGGASDRYPEVSYRSRP